MTTSADLGIQFLAAQQASPEITHNEALYQIQALSNGVINATTNAPPGSPTEGDAYIVGGSPTGAWAGRPNRIAIWTGGGWRFVPGNDDSGTAIAMGARQTGIRVFDRDADVLKIWDGSAWVEFTAGAPVDSVNGQTGVVVLDAADIPVTPSSDYTATNVQDALDEIAAAGGGGGGGGGAVDSVNGQTGVVVLDAADIAFTPPSGMVSTNVQDGIEEAFGSSGGGGGGSTPFNLSLFVSGVPPDAELLYQVVFPEALTLPADAAGSVYYNETNPTATAVFDLLKNGVSVGGISVSTGGVATFTTTGSAPVSFAIGDRLAIEAPSPDDATLATVSITLKLDR